MSKALVFVVLAACGQVHSHAAPDAGGGDDDGDAGSGGSDGGDGSDAGMLGAPGTPDLSFGTNGVKVFAASPQTEQVVFTLATGDRVILGEAITRNNHPGVLVVRLGPDGERDTTFGAAGEVFLDLGSIGAIGTGGTRGLLQADGKIMIAGGLTIDGPIGATWIVRLTVDGAIDPGVTLHRIVSVGNNSFQNLTVGPSGEIILVGASNNGGSTPSSDGVIYRLDASGALDPAFGGNGRVTYNEKALDQILAAVVQADGRIVTIVQTSSGGQFEIPTVALRRFTTTGQLDASFGTNGVAVLPAPHGAANAQVLVTPDRVNLFVAGSLSVGFTSSDMTIWKFAGDGRSDLAFGDLGVWSLDDATVNDGINDLQIGADGTLYALAGEADPGTFLAARLDFVHRDAATGAAITDFGPDGLVRTPDTQFAQALALRSDHRMLVAGAPLFPADTNDTLLRAYFW